MLSEVCHAENFRYEPGALDMIATASGGSAREALNKLDVVASQGEVTMELVAQTLSVGSAAYVLTYFTAVLAADPAAQEQALYNWQAETVDKAKMIRNFLLYCFNFEVMKTPLNQIVDPAFYLIQESERRNVTERFRALAKTAGRPFEDYWLDLTALWDFDPAKMVDHASLSISTRRFHRAIFPEGSEEGAFPLAHAPMAEIAVREAPSRARTAKRIHDEAKSGQLLQSVFQDQVRAEHIYEMATYLTQRHGLLFNVGVKLNHGLLGTGDEKKAGNLISQLTHGLSLRVKSWSPQDHAHWIYQHSVLDGSIETNVVLHIPPTALVHLEPWLRRRLRELRGSRADEEGAWSIDAISPERATGWQKNQIQRHWHLVRELWRDVDPEILDWDQQRRRKPLRELLKVPAPSGKSLGTLRDLRSIGSSRSLGPAARKQASASKMGFLSAFADDAWQVMFEGWELHEYRDRQAEIIQRKDEVERIKLEFPASENHLERRAREAALAQLRANWPADPRKRLRSWQGW
jgi:DNA polymerase III subunit gamma/tau